MSLSGNQERSEMEKKRLVWKVEAPSDQNTGATKRGRPVDPRTLILELAPAEIRTFVIHFVPNTSSTI